MEYIKITNRFKVGSEYYEKEIQRLSELLVYENLWYSKGIQYIAGIDEAGRGPLAGPVVAGAVILPKDILIEGLNDSKKISELKREKIYDAIIENAITYGVGIVDNNIIDEINILQATKRAMMYAINNLRVKPEVLFIDKERLDNINIPQESIVHGDALSVSIAAGSIVAKVTRDRIIKEMAELYPMYGFEKNKGYGTAQHIEAIKKYGACDIHRKTFIKNFL